MAAVTVPAFGPSSTGSSHAPSLVLLCATALTAAGPVVSAPAAAGTPARPGHAAPDAVEGELLVGYSPGAAPAALERARGRAAAVLADRVVRGQGARGEVELVRLPQGASRERAAAALRSDPAVAYAEPNWVVTHDATSTDTYFTNGSLWGMYGDVSSPANQYGSQAAEAWTAGNTGSAGVYVGVIDEASSTRTRISTGRSGTRPTPRTVGTTTATATSTTYGVGTSPTTTTPSTTAVPGDAWTTTARTSPGRSVPRATAPASWA